MTTIDFVRHPSNRLDIVAGLVDGILSALVLAAGRLVDPGGEGNALGLAIRVGIAAGSSSMFVFFVAHYAQLRLELVRHERELNLTRHGKLAATKLGRRIFFESLHKALLACAFSFAGALFPLILCAAMPSPVWLGLAIAIFTLAGLGALLAKTFYGSPTVWAAMLFVGGILVALIGTKLKLVS